MASDKPITSVGDLVNLYRSGEPVSEAQLDQMEFHDALTVRRDLQYYKKRT